MNRKLYLLLHLLSVHVWTVSSQGNCLSLPGRDPQDDNPQVNDPPVPPVAGTAEVWKPCKTVPERWACQDPSIKFPTVECLMADIKTCGNLDDSPAVFYSFGASTIQVRQGFKEKLDPQGSMFNDLLPKAYTDMLTERAADFQLQYSTRNDVFVARYCEAMAASAKGEVFIAYGQRKNDEGGVGTNGAGEGAFQQADKPNNRWLTYELPTLQRNPAVTKITGVDRDNNFARTTEWTAGQEPDDAHPLMPVSPASTMTVPDACNIFSNQKRDGDPGTCASVPDSCSAISSNTPDTSDPTPASSSAPSATVADGGDTSITPAPRCVLHSQDPDQGINQAYCLCDGSVTASPLPVPETGHQSDSCAYTGAIPTSASELVTTLANTYTSNCQVCTQIAFNGPSCTTQAGCTPTQGILHVQAGTSPVNIGTLTDTALYTAVSNALTALCPTPTAANSPTKCDETKKGDVKGIEWVDDNTKLNDGVLEVQVGSSGYTTAGQLQSMIKSVAYTAQKSSKNCYTKAYQTLIKRTSIAGRFFADNTTSFLTTRDRPVLRNEETTLCNMGGFAAAQMWPADWRNASSPDPAAYLDVEFKFGHPHEDNFLCDFLDELIAGLNFVAPEVAIELDSTLPEINAWCEGDFEQSMFPSH